ncbi:MAG: diacylglycerol kinase family protein [Chitinophagales bacterium]
MIKTIFSIPRLYKSFSYAFKGIYQVFRYELNMQIHLLAAVVVVIAGFVLQLTATEWCLVIFAIVGVWIAEMFNTSIEVLTDLVSPDYHELAGKVKDIAAGAVVLATLGAVVIGGIVFLPKVISLFFSL